MGKRSSAQRTCPSLSCVIVVRSGQTWSMHAPLLFYRRLVVVCLLWGILIGIASAAGLLDLWYRQTAPEFLRTFPSQWAQFRAAARWNPFLHADRLYCWWTGEPSWYTIYITTSPTISLLMPPPLPPAPAHNVGTLLGGWLMSPHPLQYVPDPAAQSARQAETRVLATVLHAYWWATQRGGLVVLAVMFVCGGVMRVAQRWQQRPRRPRGARPATVRWTDTVIMERLCTIVVPQQRAWGIPLARVVAEALPGSRTAKVIVRMFAAHATWPASLHHHGAAPGGLLAHTTAVVQQALTHPGARHATLGQAFLLTASAHDLGKLQTYVPASSGGFVQTAVFHPNRSADMLQSIPAFAQEFPPALRTIIVTTLRYSAGRALTPVPQNAPPEVHDLLAWLADVDHAAVHADVVDLRERLAAADATPRVAALLTARAPSRALPAPVYRTPDATQEFLVRESARVVWLELLGLTEHPGAQATAGHHDPVWDHLLLSVRAHGMRTGAEQVLLIPGVSTRVRAVELLHAEADATRAQEEPVSQQTSTAPAEQP
jgi:hypothetical protein